MREIIIPWTILSILNFWIREKTHRGSARRVDQAGTTLTVANGDSMHSENVGSPGAFPNTL